MMSVRWVVAVLALLVTAGSIASDVGSGGLQPMDVFELEWVRDPRISPDGSRIVYVRSGMDRMADRRTSSLWIINSDGTGHAPLVTGFRGAAQPRWSPDGSRILFTATDGERTQLHALYLARNTVSVLTQVEQSISGISWSPDGQYIGFMMQVVEKPEPIAKLPAPPKGAQWAKPPVVVEHGPYRRDGRGMTDPGSIHAFVLPADGGTPRRVTDQGSSLLGRGFSRVAWDADSRSIYVSLNFKEDGDANLIDSNLYRIDLEGGARVQVTDRVGPDYWPRVSPNGRYLAWLGYDDAGRALEHDELSLLDLRSGEVRNIPLGIDRGIDTFFWQQNSRGLFVTYADRGIGKVARLSLAGEREDLIDDLGGTALTRPYTGGSFSVSHDGTIAWTRNRPDRPADLGVRTPRGRTSTLTRLNEDALGHRALAEIHDLRFKSSHDGRDVQAWYAVPSGLEQKGPLPTILEIHGGPFAAYGPVFSAEVQLYAAAGYAVLFVNPRGSTSYGETFANLIDKQYPGEDFDDLMSAVDALVDQGVADPEQLYVTGGSGGGVLTAWIVGHTDRFRAAVSAKPIVNWFSHALIGDSYAFWYRYWLPGLPWENLESYMARSPIMHAGNVTTPTMFLTGEADLRTPISESEQMYAALRLRKIDTALVRVPGASHGIAARPSHLIAKVAYVLGWFERYAPSANELSP